MHIKPDKFQFSYPGIFFFSMKNKKQPQLFLLSSYTCSCFRFLLPNPFGVMCLSNRVCFSFKTHNYNCNHDLICREKCLQVFRSWLEISKLHHDTQIMPYLIQLVIYGQSCSCVSAGKRCVLYLDLMCPSCFELPQRKRFLAVNTMLPEALLFCGILCISLHCQLCWLLAASLRGLCSSSALFWRTMCPG